MNTSETISKQQPTSGVGCGTYIIVFCLAAVVFFIGYGAGVSKGKSIISVEARKDAEVLKLKKEVKRYQKFYFFLMAHQSELSAGSQEEFDELQQAFIDGLSDKHKD